MILGDNGQLANELRAFANLVEAYPELKIDRVEVVANTFHSNDENHVKANMRKAVRAVKRRVKVEKKYYGEFFKIEFQFGNNIYYRWTTKREEVCEAKVVGQEYVPQQTIGGYTKDVIEWECDPILKDDNE